MKILIPDAIEESVFTIDLEQLKSLRISGLLIDIDNTIVPWGVPDIEETFLNWISDTQKAGFKLCLVSNAREQRAVKIAEDLGIPAVGQALKPLNRAFRRGMKLLDLPAEKVAVIGDQLFTDIYGGNRLGLYTILINPLSRTELGATKIMRKIEQTTLRRMVRLGLISADSVEKRQGLD